MQDQASRRRRQLTIFVAVIAVLLTAFIVWQRSGPRTLTVTAGKFPEELVYVRSNDDIVNGGAMFTPPKHAAKPVAIIGSSPNSRDSRR